MDAENKTRGLNPGMEPWKPGQSGNPSGRKKLTQRQRQYNDIAQQTFHEIATPEELKLVMQSLLRDAQKPGNYRSKELVLAYAMGKPAIKIEHQKSGIDRLHELLDAMPDVLLVPSSTYSVVDGGSDDDKR